MKHAYLVLLFVAMWLTSACEQSDRSMNKGDHGASATQTGTDTIHNLSITTLDTEKAYELCAEALSGYYKAIWNGLEFDVSRYVDNQNFQRYTEKKIKSQYNLFRKNNLTYNQVKEVKMDAEKVDIVEGEQNVYYLKMNARIIKDVGEYAESTEFLVQDLKGKLVIVDWYTSGKDSYDSIMRGESQVINNPAIWENSEWAGKLK
ncbi:hypothetical protein ABIE27_000300 [Paenibacillus sp. 4624]|uniref:Lipoprotein n=1 Tax=Paenibacillus amylolyticus TaxID=1451 RepID=A0A5M9WMR6_PAEAM|nr:hypothetical protein [Paenibacillus amylolyticus]KAA8782819.1 hypothetical protein EC604_03035 [Paenibacillus amylolyticus]